MALHFGDYVERRRGLKPKFEKRFHPNEFETAEKNFDSIIKKGEI
jgi:hypothetical protein